MRYILILLFIIAIFAIAFIVAPSLTNPTGLVVASDNIVADNNEGHEKELPNFRLYTKAVCENASGFILCHDELFASCGNFEYMLPKNEVNGQGIFNEDWQDPRNS